MSEATTTEEELRKQLDERDSMLSSLKAKTKLYIQKLNKDSTDKLAEEKEMVRQLQGKVEAARVYISKQREQSQDLATSNETLQKELSTLQSQCKLDKVWLIIYNVITAQ